MLNDGIYFKTEVRIEELNIVNNIFSLNILVDSNWFKTNMVVKNAIFNSNYFTNN